MLEYRLQVWISILNTSLRAAELLGEQKLHGMRSSHALLLQTGSSEGMPLHDQDSIGVDGEMFGCKSMMTLDDSFALTV